MASITLLCLNEEAPESGAELLDAIGEADLDTVSTKVVVHPAELFSSADQPEAPEILVIDCPEHRDYDIPGLISGMRIKRGLGIMVAVSNHQQRLQATAAGADIAFRLPLDRPAFKADLVDLAEHYRLYAQSVAERRTLLKTAAADDADDGHAGLDAADRSARVAEKSTQGPSRGQLAKKQASAAWGLLSTENVLCSPNGKWIPLTAQEWRFLRALFGSQPHCLTYQNWFQIEGSRGDEHAKRRCLAVTVSRVRQRCQEMGVALPIDTDRGVGYRFRGKSLLV